MSNETSIFPILSVNCIGTLGYSIVMPFMVFRVAKMVGNSVLSSFAASSFVIAASVFLVVFGLTFMLPVRVKT
jgi:hypothetical protein